VDCETVQAYERAVAEFAARHPGRFTLNMIALCRAAGRPEPELRLDGEPLLQTLC
jgi:hypothetical protein